MMCAFLASLVSGIKGRLAFFACALLLAMFLCGGVQARSALSPRHSGIEPPGGPRPIDVLPGNSPSRTAEGGMGYVDAYGNTVTRDEQPREVKRPPRLRPGAYGGNAAKERIINIPEPDGKPLWKFQ